MWHNTHQFIVLMQAFVHFSLWCWQIFIHGYPNQAWRLKSNKRCAHFSSLCSCSSSLLFFFFFCNTRLSMKRYATSFYLFLLNGKRWKKKNLFKRTIVCKLSGNYNNWGDCWLTQFMSKNSDKQKEQLEAVWIEGWSMKLGRQATTADYTFTFHPKQEDIRLKVL